MEKTDADEATTEKTGADEATTEKTGETVELVVGTGVETGEVMVVTGVGWCHFFPRDKTAAKDGRCRSAVEVDSDRSNGRGCSVSLMSSSEQN